MALVMAVRPLVRRWCGAPAGYALWIIPALRLLMPVGSSPAPAIDPSHGPIDVVLRHRGGRAGEPGMAGLAVGGGSVLFAGGRSSPTTASCAARSTVRSGSTRPERRCSQPRRWTAPRRSAFTIGASWCRWTRGALHTAERDLAMRHELRHLNAGHLIANAAALAMGRCTGSIRWLPRLPRLSRGPGAELRRGGDRRRRCAGTRGVRHGVVKSLRGAGAVGRAARR
jgi:hypothetical protein